MENILIMKQLIFSFENDLNIIERKEGKDYKDKYEEIALKLINIIEQKGEKMKKK